MVKQNVLDRIALAGEDACAGVSSGAWSLEALAAGYTGVDLRETAEEISAGWRAIGATRPDPAPSTARTCSVNECHAMAFVRLKTAGGARSLCLVHWQSPEFQAPRPDAA